MENCSELSCDAARDTGTSSNHRHYTGLPLRDPCNVSAQFKYQRMEKLWSWLNIDFNYNSPQAASGEEKFAD